jgi:hypothetical protein
LRNFALIQQLLGGFDVFALVVSHALTGTINLFDRRAA